MKTTFITDINKIKFEVNTEVARLAFAGELDEKANEIPYKLIPGRTPHYRCCVYREREIIRERVQLPDEPDSSLHLQINADACISQ